MKYLALAVCLLCAVVMVGCTTAKGQTVSERQADAQNMKNTTLEELRTKEPTAAGRMDRAIGYGVFKQTGAAMLIGGTSNGFGIITDKKAGKDTYMRAFTGSAGLGFGIKNYRLVILFYDADVMNRFASTGWDFGAQATATATTGNTGGEVGDATSATRAMDVYEFTEKGIFLRADVRATRFWPDKSLNIE